MSLDFPRNLYFGAEDWAAAKPGITEQDLAHVRNQRHQLVGHVTHKAEKLLAATRTLRDFDSTGNAGAALDHIEAIRDDLAKLTTNLITDVEDAEARYDQHSAPETPAVAVEPTPQAPATAGPKPHGGVFRSYEPREGEVVVQISGAPSPADVAARLSSLAARMPVR